jgi:hypothetical protein
MPAFRERHEFSDARIQLKRFGRQWHEAPFKLRQLRMHAHHLERMHTQATVKVSSGIPFDPKLARMKMDFQDGI